MIHCRTQVSDHALSHERPDLTSVVRPAFLDVILATTRSAHLHDLYSPGLKPVFGNDVEQVERALKIVGRPFGVVDKTLASFGEERGRGIHRFQLRP